MSEKTSPSNLPIDPEVTAYRSDFESNSKRIDPELQTHSSLPSGVPVPTDQLAGRITALEEKIEKHWDHPKAAFAAVCTLFALLTGVVLTAQWSASSEVRETTRTLEANAKEAEKHLDEQFQQITRFQEDFRNEVKRAKQARDEDIELTLVVNRILVHTNRGRDALASQKDPGRARQFAIYAEEELNVARRKLPLDSASQKSLDNIAPMVWSLRMDASWNLGMLGEVERYAQQLVQTSSKDSAGRYFLALKKMGRASQYNITSNQAVKSSILEEVIRELHDISEAPDANSMSLIYLGIAYFDAGEYQTAIGIFDKFLAGFPGAESDQARYDAETHAQIGLAKAWSCLVKFITGDSFALAQTFDCNIDAAAIGKSDGQLIEGFLSAFVHRRDQLLTDERIANAAALHAVWIISALRRSSRLGECDDYSSNVTTQRRSFDTNPRYLFEDIWLRVPDKVIDEFKLRREILLPPESQDLTLGRQQPDGSIAMRYVVRVEKVITKNYMNPGGQQATVEYAELIEQMYAADATDIPKRSYLPYDSVTSYENLAPAPAPVGIVN